jgi:deoxyuridine 5'-triphosphate nucleotidohydrolase
MTSVDSNIHMSSVDSNIHMSSVESDYYQGNSFNRSVLRPFKRENIPDDLIDLVYIPVSSIAEIPQNLTSSFVRGVIEPSLCFEDNYVVFSVTLRISDLVENWITSKGIKFVKTETTPRLQLYQVHGTESLDLLSILYDESTPTTRDKKKYERYLQMTGVLKSVAGCISESIEEYKLPFFRVVRVDPRAILPSKKRASDVGFDLTIISKVKDLGTRTALYDTGIIIQPPMGYYIEILPRSSLSKSGYLQINSIGIIDPNYLDTLKVPLTRVDDSVPEIQLPFTGFQLILRRPIHGVVLECSREQLADTSRGTGGFGSTGALNQHTQKSSQSISSL